MKIEQFRQRAGVTEKYVPGAGATALLRNSRVGLRRAGRSRPRHSRYPENICRGHRTDLRRIQTGSAQHPLLIRHRCTLDRNLIDRRIP